MKEKGFTLVEVLVAVALLAVVLLAMAPLFLSSVKLNSTAFDKTTADSLAKQQLEALTLLPSGDPTYLRMPAQATCWTSDPRCNSSTNPAFPTGCPCLNTAAVTMATPGSTTMTPFPAHFYFDSVVPGASGATNVPVANPYNIYTTVQEFSAADLTTPLAASGTQNYALKRVDVFVDSIKAGLIGLNGVTMTGYLRNTYSYPNNPGF